ncbi:MAG: acyl--CoA ligase [Anaerolineaceae bacterium]
MERTYLERLAVNAQNIPTATALSAPGRPDLNYLQLYRHLQNTMARLNQLGIGRSDAVAIVLPNGAEMATAFLSVAACASAAPLNPAYQKQEFDFYLEDLQAAALIVAAGSPSPAIQSAKERGIPLIELSFDPLAAAGLFELHGEPRELMSPGGAASAEEIALILHTSGTTSRPKMVPLSGSNILTSARNVAATLQLSPADRCLNIMPLFHIHGLIASLLASVYAGGSVVCTGGFSVFEFFNWLQDFQPTWYSAVPSMHQAILSRAVDKQTLIQANPLRFIRSASASLAPQVMQALEDTFHAPVIEAYGMTEAAHQMASNPLPPQARKFGSVGPAAGPQVAIMAEDKSDLYPAGQIGEVVIRGENVMSGYRANPEANANAFSAGWFRTGDQGYIDSDGYLYLTGRLKEIINRGGEKVSPREVDEVLLDHPGVAQAVTFAVPDARLGEDVAAAVVLKDPRVTSQELRQFAAQRLVYYKVPRQILILAEIPKGPTGKIQRIGLAEKLGLTAKGNPAEDKNL